MIKMVEAITITGLLGQDENWEQAKWTLEGQTTWNGVEAEVKIFLEDILGQYDGKEIVLTIAPVKNKMVEPK